MPKNVKTTKAKSTTRKPKAKAATGKRGAFDKYGFMVGSARSKACTMLEGGCTMGDVTKALGQTHYNVLRILAERGHVITKGPKHTFTLEHKGA